MPGSGRPVLILGGTAEAAELAERLHAGGREVVMSLLGLTGPAERSFPVRTGGFGGAAGLADELRRSGYGLLIDASHPFASQMPANAAGAATEVGVERLRLLRPGWVPEAGDHWLEVDDLASAAGMLADLDARRAFLSVGRVGSAAFAGLGDVRLVVRTLGDQPAPPVAGATVVVGRGPFTVDGERRLFREQGIDVLVTRNSGGPTTAAKVVAARQLGLPVVMVRRPTQPPGPCVEDVAAALRWIEDRVR